MYNRGPPDRAAQASTGLVPPARTLAGALAWGPHMKARLHLIMLLAIVTLLTPSPARAGMSIHVLNDIVRMRFENLSFFLAALLLCALVVMLLWNHLRKDFPRLPRLSYPKACGMVVLWGLMFLLVLTMIAGARELMTPGAWDRRGVGYQLNSAELQAYQTARREHLAQLQAPLWRYAQEHNGQFPPARFRAGDSRIGMADPRPLADPLRLR
jgi:hypothetical protein